MPEGRRLDNWLDTFLDWTMPRSESPDSIIYWCGLFTLAAVVRRHVKVSKQYFGSWNCYPSLYIIFVGPQGVIKKSTTMGYAEELLDAIKDECSLDKSPAGVTVPDLLKRIQDANESSVYMLSSEFGVLIQKAGIGIYEILTDLYDGKKNIDEGTISRGYVFAADPCLNMLVCTTPIWIAANMAEDVIGGGFGSRIIPIFEDTVRQRGLYWNKKVNMNSIDEIGKDLIHDLKLINKIKGDFILPDDVFQFMTNWYEHNCEVPPGTDSKLTGFYQRQPAHIHKVAMLIHVARSDSLTLTMDDFIEAIEVMDAIKPKINGTFKAIGKNVYATDMVSIAKYIQKKRRVARPEVLRIFYSAAEPGKLDELLTGLLQMEDIKLETENQVIYYTFSGKE